MRLAIISLLGCVLFSMGWFTGIVWPAVTLYLRLWLPIVAELAVVGWAYTSLSVRNETTAFARLPRALFNVGSHGQQVVWVVNALATVALYTYWLNQNGLSPLPVPYAALRVVWAYVWWPSVLAFANCPALYGYAALYGGAEQVLHMADTLPRPSAMCACAQPLCGMLQAEAGSLAALHVGCGRHRVCDHASMVGDTERHPPATPGACGGVPSCPTQRRVHRHRGACAGGRRQRVPGLPEDSRTPLRRSTGRRGGARSARMAHHTPVRHRHL